MLCLFCCSLFLLGYMHGKGGKGDIGGTTICLFDIAFSFLLCCRPQRQLLIFLPFFLSSRRKRISHVTILPVTAAAAIGLHLAKKKNLRSYSTTCLINLTQMLHNSFRFVSKWWKSQVYTSQAHHAVSVLSLFLSISLTHFISTLLLYVYMCTSSVFSFSSLPSLLCYLRPSSSLFFSSIYPHVHTHSSSPSLLVKSALASSISFREKDVMPSVTAKSPAAFGCALIFAVMCAG